MFGLGKKKTGAPIDKAAAIKKAAEKGIFLTEESLKSTPSVAEETSPVPTSTTVAIASPPAPEAPAAPEPAAPPVAKAAKVPEPKVAKPAPAPKPVAQSAPPAEIRFSNGEEYVQFARRRPGANMKSFLDMAKQVRLNS